MVARIFALTAIMMGMVGPRFAKFQTLLERINAIAKIYINCARGQILCTGKTIDRKVTEVLMNFSAKIFISVMPSQL